MKTALQELISELEEVKNTNSNTIQDLIFFDIVLSVIEGKYLEKERIQIENAYTQGAIDFQCGTCEFTNGDDMEYFEETYK